MAAPRRAWRLAHGLPPVTQAIAHAAPAIDRPSPGQAPHTSRAAVQPFVDNQDQPVALNPVRRRPQALRRDPAGSSGPAVAIRLKYRDYDVGAHV